jgi:hypothetical protein
VAYFVLLYLYPAKSTNPGPQLYFTLLYEIITSLIGQFVAGPAGVASPNYAAG